MNIFLIGYRCCGKTTVGLELSKRMKWPFIDTDDRIVQTTGRSIACIVAESGWDAFREIEKKVIATSCLLDHHIIATGGGAVLDPDNVSLMKKSGIVVWLQASPDTIRKRLLIDPCTDSFRPALSSLGTSDEIEQILASRHRAYETAMDISVFTDRLDIPSICKTIMNHISTLDLTGC